MKKDARLILKYAGRYWWMYLLGIASVLLVDAVNVYMPQMTGEVTDALAMKAADMVYVRSMCMRILIMGAGITLGRFGWRFFIFGACRLVEKNLRNDLFAHLETLSVRYFTEHKTGDLMAHFTNDLMAVRQLAGMTVVTAFDASVMLVMVLSQMIHYVSLSLTGAAVIPLAAIIIGDVFFGKAMHRRFLEKQDAFSGLSDLAQESVSGIRVIKAFVQERGELYHFAAKNAFVKEKNLNVVRLVALVFPLLDLVIGISSLLTLLYGGWLAINGDISIGQFVAFNSYIGMLVWPMIAVGEAISSVSQGMASVKRLRVIMEEKPDITDGRDTSITRLEGNIAFHRLDFSYPGARDRMTLHDIDLTVAKGETLGIIGRTGSGKTTLVSLLERLYDTKEADMICLDGHRLNTIPFCVLRRDIACVPQDNFLFSDTVSRNIAFGADNAGEKEIIKAAVSACVHDNIMEFSDQYETLLGERGVTVSGGQKQRISIARALMKDAPILILDDSLSAVDTDTEERILENLKENRKGRTTIIIAHRISAIQHSDHILVLDDGAAVQYGTHEELAACAGLYRSLYEKQQLEKQLKEA